MSKPLEDYALVGDGRSAALVGREGDVDWLCWPDFDGDTVFAALLGDASNGCWTLRPVGDLLRVSRRYLPDTLVLETTLETAEGVVRLTDWMAWNGEPPALHRRMECLRGRVCMGLRLAVRLDHGRAVPVAFATDARWMLRSGAHTLWLDGGGQLQWRDGALWGERQLAAGQRHAYTLAYERAGAAAPESLDATIAFWRDWSAQCQATGPYADAIRRSLITLKGLTSDRWGGIVAAPTTSLPEVLGGRCNWDYRYCWLRDASYTLLALVKGGYRGEAGRWRDWLLRAIQDGPQALQVLYRVDGSTAIHEWEAEWLPGYAGSRPVRIGNAAAGQRQLDLYGGRGRRRVHPVRFLAGPCPAVAGSP